MSGGGFPFFGHRTIREVDETERLLKKRRTAEENRRLWELLRRWREAGVLDVEQC